MAVMQTPREQKYQSRKNKTKMKEEEKTKRRLSKTRNKVKQNK
mgnify:CR=1 FL=1